MTKPDIETAISREFRNNFKELKFIPETCFYGIDGTPFITLKREYDVPGSYPVTINVSLFKEEKEPFFRYNGKYELNTNIDLTYNDENEPVVSFNSPVCIKKIM